MSNHSVRSTVYVQAAVVHFYFLFEIRKVTLLFKIEKCDVEGSVPLNYILSLPLHGPNVLPACSVTLSILMSVWVELNIHSYN